MPAIDRLRRHRPLHRPAGAQLFQRHVHAPGVFDGDQRRARHPDRRRSPVGRRRGLRAQELRTHHGVEGTGRDDPVLLAFDVPGRGSCAPARSGSTPAPCASTARRTRRRWNTPEWLSRSSKPGQGRLAGLQADDRFDSPPGKHHRQVRTAATARRANVPLRSGEHDLDCEVRVCAARPHAPCRRWASCSTAADGRPISQRRQLARRSAALRRDAATVTFGARLDPATAAAAQGALHGVGIRVVRALDQPLGGRSNMLRASRSCRTRARAGRGVACRTIGRWGPP
jgi:hypothetical protein